MTATGGRPHRWVGSSGIVRATRQGARDAAVGVHSCPTHFEHDGHMPRDPLCRDDGCHQTAEWVVPLRSLADDRTVDRPVCGKHVSFWRRPDLVQNQGYRVTGPIRRV